MKNLNIRALFLSLLATLSVYVGCIGPDPIVPENYAIYPLELKGTEQPDGSFRLSWNAIKSVDFVEYQVIKNTGDSVPFIADSAINKLNRISRTLELTKRISDADSTTFIDSFSLPTKRTFFRVFAVLKGRNLSSQNVEMSTKTDALEADINPDDVLYIPEARKIVVGDQTLRKMTVFDISTNSNSNIFFNINFTQNLEMAYGRFNNSTELFLPNGFSSSIFNLSGVFIANFINPRFSNTDAFLYEKTTNTFLAMSSQPSLTISSFTRPSNNNFNSLPSTSTAVFPTARQQLSYVIRQAPNAREAIALSTTNGNIDLIWFKYDANCQNIAKISGLNAASANITKRPLAIMPDNQGFITNEKGLIFNRNAVLVDSLALPEPQTRYPDMVFSADGKRLYAIRTVNERRDRLVDVYTYPNFKFERSIAFKSKPSRIFQDGNELILVGRSPNNPLLTMIEKVKL